MERPAGDGVEGLCRAEWGPLSLLSPTLGKLTDTDRDHFVAWEEVSELTAGRTYMSFSSPPERQARRSPVCTSSRLRPPLRLTGWRRHRLLVPGHRCRGCCNPGRTLFHFPAGGAEDAPCTRSGEIAPGARQEETGRRERKSNLPFLDATAAAGSWEGAHRTGAPSRDAGVAERPRALAGHRWQSLQVTETLSWAADSRCCLEPGVQCPEP
ncbi:hypothetical protein Celaphus_00000189, partial [Cervus elaphus hippelaphus]